MEIASRERGMEWLLNHGYSESVLADIEGGMPCAGFSIDPDSGRKTAFARTVSEGILPGPDVVLIVDETGIWPSCEHKHLFLQYRARGGPVLDLDRYPAHVFTPGDTEYQTGLIALSLYFCWGVLLADSTGMVVRTSHDEWMQVGCADPKRLAAAVEALQSFGLNPLAPSGRNRPGG